MSISCCFDRDWSHIQDLQAFIKWSFVFFETHLFPKNRNWRFSRFWDCKQIFRNMIWDFSWIIISHLVGSNVQHNGFWGPWSWPVIPKTIKNKKQWIWSNLLCFQPRHNQQNQSKTCFRAGKHCFLQGVRTFLLSQRVVQGCAGLCGGLCKEQRW